MKRVLIGCGVVKRELEDALSSNGADGLDIIWMEAGLHNNPQNLRNVLQEKIDSLTDYDEIILGYGLCGNALIDIAATNCDIIYPRTDDCISALMCENCKMSELRRTSFFTSRGWLTNGTEDEYDKEKKSMLEKYDEETAEELLEMIYGHYQNLVYMKAEEEISDEDMALAKEKADKMGINLIIEDASITLYKKLIEVDETYPMVKRLKKGEVLTLKHFMD